MEVDCKRFEITKTKEKYNRAEIYLLINTPITDRIIDLSKTGQYKKDEENDDSEKMPNNQVKK
jgi:hypothetical protein